MGRRACLCVCVCCLGRNVWVGGGFVHVLRMFVSVCGWKLHVCVGVRCEAAELSRRLSPLSGVCRSWKPDTRCLQSSSYPRIPCHPSPHVYSISCERGTEQLWSLCVIIFCAQARSLFLFLIPGVRDLYKPLTTSITFLLENHSACCLMWIAHYLF